jgi:fucose 4-O-acetylase-like acetyltransferase
MRIVRFFSNIPDPVYWTGVVVLVLLLLGKEVIWATNDDRFQKWEKRINIISIPLLVIYVLIIISKIIAIISWLLKSYSP